MKVGDLIVDKEFNDAFGIIVYKDEYGDVNAYRVLANNGVLDYLDRGYVENRCEVLSESRRLSKTAR